MSATACSLNSPLPSPPAGGACAAWAGPAGSTGGRQCGRGAPPHRRQLCDGSQGRAHERGGHVQAPAAQPRRPSLSGLRPWAGQGRMPGEAKASCFGGPRLGRPWARRPPAACCAGCADRVRRPFPRATHLTGTLVCSVQLRACVPASPPCLCMPVTSPLVLSSCRRLTVLWVPASQVSRPGVFCTAAVCASPLAAWGGWSGVQWLTLRLVVCCRCQLAGSASRWLPQIFRYPMHTLLPLAPAASCIQMIHSFKKRISITQPQRAVCKRKLGQGWSGE